MFFAEKITVIGVGLIGGSAGMAALRRGVAAEVWGVARRRETIDAAVSSGAVTRGTLSLSEGVKDADFVLASSSVGSIPGLIREALPFMKPGAVVTDAGSVKREIVERVRPFVPEDISFTGSHPIAGSEKSGVESADAGLFEGAACVVTPLPGEEKSAGPVIRFWEALGMRVVSMTPDAHDRMLAFTSHLPHLAACGLVNAVIEGLGGPALSGGGFRDSTRVAGGPEGIWTDIILSNRDNLTEALEAFSGALSGMESALREGDRDKIAGFLKKARAGRERLLDGKKQEERNV